jgi:adenylate cyclase
LSKQVIERGAAAPRTQIATAMFLDLAGSTGLAEKHGPDVYTKIMAQYYSTVSGAVDQNGGAVYKYEGDGILALFFGRAAQEEDAHGALEAARRVAATVSADMAGKGLPEVGIRIGISTGPVAVGMLRFGERASVSTMGDAVHRAYRLQEMGRELMQEGGGSAVVTLVDGATAVLARDDERQMRLRTTTMLRGRSAPTKVYHLTA